MKTFPLKKAYPFAEAKGLGSEVARIKALKVTWATKTSSPRMRRGEMIRLFEKHRILSDFIKEEWQDGLKPAECKHMERCRRASDEYRQRSGKDGDGPEGEESGPEGSPAPPVVERPITPEVGPPLESSPPPVSEKQRDIEAQLIGRLQSLTPAQFERVVGELLNAKGLTNVQVTGRTGDGGVDGECSMPFLKLKVAFQAKRYAVDNSIGANPIRNFKGGLIGRYDRGIFITTSTFTPGAREEAEQPGITLVLIGGHELVSQMIELGLGIKEKPVVETEVDESFFEGLGTSTTP